MDGVRYNAACMAGILGIGADELEPLFLLYTLEHGDTSSWKAPVRGLVDFLVDDVLSDDSLADRLDEAQAEDLTAARALVDAVADRTACSAGEMTRMLSAFDSSLEKEDVELLYLFYGGKYLSDPDWEMSMEEFFNYVADTLLDDPRFEGLLDQEYRAQIDDYQVQIERGDPAAAGRELLPDDGHHYPTPANLGDHSLYCRHLRTSTRP